jgi:tRNA A-37 threonylcarbamoyl transferase component Bud32
MVVIAKHRALLEKIGLATLAGAKAFRGELVKDHHGRRDIFRISCQDDDGGSRVLFLKRNWRPYKKDGIASLLRHGRVWSIARQEWENSCALEKAGLHVAELVAYGEDCGPLWERFSFIITEAAPGQTVQEFIRDCGDRALRARVFDALAHEIRKMHDAGLATPDLFTRHVFVEVSKDEPKFCLIDMARVDKRASLSERMRARDLAALNITAPLRFVSACERVRFLRDHAGEVDRSIVKLIGARVAHLLKRRKFQDFLRNNEPNVK